MWSKSQQQSNSDQSSINSASTSEATQSTSKKEKPYGIFISALGDAPLRVANEAEDEPAKMIKLLDARYLSRTVSRIAVQTLLFRMSYNDQIMTPYIDLFSSVLFQLERMGKDAAIAESHKSNRNLH